MITLDKVRKCFGSLIAVDELSLHIDRGEVFGLLGPNGAGKTTCINLAVGLLRPDRGTVRIADLGSPLDPNVRLKLGVATQSLALYDELTAKENLDFFGRLQRLPPERLTERVKWALDFVQLADRAHSRVSTYSGGMKRRLNLAVAMVHDPEILMLDEPTVAVDPQSRNAIFERIALLKRLGRTIVLTTHYIEEAERLCDRVGIMDHGRLLALDTVPNLIRDHGGKPRLVVQVNGDERRIETDDPLAELTKLRDTVGLGEFRVERPNLESVFLNLTGRQLRD